MASDSEMRQQIKDRFANLEDLAAPDERSVYRRLRKRRLTRAVAGTVLAVGLVGASVGVGRLVDGSPDRSTPDLAASSTSESEALVFAALALDEAGLIDYSETIQKPVSVSPNDSGGVIVRTKSASCSSSAEALSCVLRPEGNLTLTVEAVDGSFRITEVSGTTSENSRESLMKFRKKVTSSGSPYVHPLGVTLNGHGRRYLTAGILWIGDIPAPGVAERCTAAAIDEKGKPVWVSEQIDIRPPETEDERVGGLISFGQVPDVNLDSHQAVVSCSGMEGRGWSVDGPASVIPMGDEGVVVSASASWDEATSGIIPSVCRATLFNGSGKAIDTASKLVPPVWTEQQSRTRTVEILFRSSDSIPASSAEVRCRPASEAEAGRALDG